MLSEVAIARLFSNLTVTKVHSRLKTALLATGLFVVGLVGLLAPTTSAHAAAGINKTLNFQGRLLTSGGAVVADGNYNFRMKIYQDGPGNVAGDTGGTLLWTELWQNTVATGSTSAVVVKNGYFSLNLGSYCAFSGGACQGITNTVIDFNQDTLWLSMDVGGTAVSNTPTYDGELVPMRRLASAVYALQAQNSNTLGGLSSGQYLQLAQGVQADASTTNASIFVNKTGITANVLDIQRGGADVLLINNAGQSLFRPTTDSQTALQVQKAGTTTTAFTVDSSNSRIGIGLNNPSYAVDAVGSVNASVSVKIAGVDVCTSSGCTVNSTSGILNQSSLQSSANFNISGTGTATSFLATAGATPAFDVATAGVLNIGTSTATSITIGQNNIVTNIGGSLNLSGTSTSPGRVTFQGTSSSNATTNQYGLQNQVIFTPSGGALGNLYGTNNLPTISTMTNNIANIYASYNRIDSLSGYTGLTNVATAVEAAGPVIGGTKAYTNYYGVKVDAATNTGVSGNTATNYGVGITVPNGNSAFTTNYGLYIQGTGGGLATNYSLYNSSSLASVFTGSVAANAYTQNGNNVCDASGNCSGAGAYIVNGSSSQTGNFNITGTGTVQTSLLTPVIDTPSAGVLTIGAGATSTSIAIGSATTPTTIAANTLSLNTPTISTNAATLGLFNTNALTVTALGVATNITLGATTGQAVIQNPTLVVGFSGAENIVGNGSAGLTVRTQSYNGASQSSGTLVLQSADVSGTTSNTGNVRFNSGNSTTTGNTGSVTIVSGNAVAGISGNLSIDNGTFTSGAPVINIGSANATAVNIGKTTSNALTTINGTAIVKPTAGNDSSTAFLVQNAAGSTALAVDTTILNTLVSNGSFESGTTGWVAAGTGASIAQSAAQRYIGSNSLAFTTGTAVGNSARLTVGTGLSTSTTYTLSFYAKAGTAMSTISASYSPDGTAANETDCAVFAPSSSVVTTGWTRYTCTINTSATSSNASGYIAIKQSDATSRILYIDAVQLEAGSAITQAAIANTGFETGTTGWAALGGTTSIAQNATPYTGAQSLRISASNTANTGAKYTTGSTNPTQLALGTIYTFSFWAKASGTAMTNLGAAYAYDGATEINCQLSSTNVSTTAWNMYTCTFTTPSFAALASAYVIIKMTSAPGAAQTWDIDNVQLTNLGFVGTASSYKETGIALNGVVNSPTTFKNQSDSTTAFQVQNTAGVNMLGVDTLNARVNVGTLGTAAGQLYVSGAIPTATLGRIGTGTGTQPFGIALQGRYAYVTNSGSGTMTIYDVSSPASPASISTTATGTSPRNLAVQGNYAYIPNYSSNTVTIYNISNPTLPVLVSTIATGASSGPHGIKVQGRYAYVVDYTSSLLAIYDVSNPSNPSLVGSVSAGLNPLDIYIQGRYAYLASPNAHTFSIYDVGTPASPTLVGTIAVADTTFDVGVQGRYAYVLINGGSNTMAVYDISNAASPTLTGAVAIDSGARGLSIQGRYAYVSSSSDNSVGVYDITNPAIPVRVGKFSTDSQPFNIVVQGRYAYVPDYGANTFTTYDVGGTYTQQLEAGGIESSSLRVNTEASVGGNLSLAGNLSASGSVQFNGNFGTSGSVQFQNTTNSTGAFKVQNASGTPLFVVDTLTTSNLLSNPGFENGTTGWALNGSATIAQNVTSGNVYHGQASLLVTTSATASGASVSTFTAAITPAQYTFSFYAMGGTNTGVLGVTITGGSAPACTLAPTAFITTGFQRYSCTFTSSASNVTAINILTTGGSSGTFWIDGAQLVSGAAAAPYSASGAIQLRGNINSPVTFQGTSNSTTAFQIQNAAGTISLLIADSVNNSLTVGSATVDATQVNLQLDSSNVFADAGTCAATTNQGALYYSANTNAIRSCVNASWEDVVTTSGLGILAFGVIPDAANAASPGDIIGVSSLTSSPCKVTWQSTTAVQVNPCLVYSGGRKLTVPQTTVSVAGLAANAYANICFSQASGSATTNGTPTLLTGNATETTAVVPTFSANNPVECLATVRASGVAGQIGFIWDTRTFTNTVKEFATISAVNANGYIVVGNGVTAGSVITTVSATPTLVRGIVAATAGTSSTTTINGIIAIRGQAEVKFLSGATVTVNNLVQPTTTAGYSTTTAFVAGNTTNFLFGGPVEQTISTSCTTATTLASACQYSAPVDFSPTR